GPSLPCAPARNQAAGGPHTPEPVSKPETQGDTTLVAVKIRLKRMGKIRNPFYRVVVVDAHKKRDGRVIEEIGTYNPKSEPSHIHVVSERAQYWLGVGAQPTEPAAALLRATGDLASKSGTKASGPKQGEAPKSKEEVF